MSKNDQQRVPLPLDVEKQHRSQREREYQQALANYEQEKAIYQAYRREQRRKGCIILSTSLTVFSIIAIISYSIFRFVEHRNDVRATEAAIANLNTQTKSVEVTMTAAILVITSGYETSIAATRSRIATLTATMFTATPTATHTPTSTATSTTTSTPTHTVTYTPTNTRTYTATFTPSRTPTYTYTPRPSRTPTTTATRTKTPRPTPTRTSPPRSTGLHIGGTATVQTTEGDRLNVRRGPGTNYGVVTSLANGSTVELLDGPTNNGGYSWWQIRMSDGREGWVVASADSVRTLVPGGVVTNSNSDNQGAENSQSCGDIPARFRTGQTIIVSQKGDDLRLMTDYTLGARGALGQLTTGNHAEIVDGPECAFSSYYGEYVWYWFVYSPRHNAHGWIQDGLRNERWICPTSDPNCDR